MTYQELSSTPEFQNLHPVKQQILKEMLQNGRLTTPEALLPKFMSINQELAKRNLSFTKEESTLLIQMIKDTMSPQDQQRVDMLLNLFYR
ncbi:MAG: hypothetical protein IJ801_01715 [Lachnospiraceae bacterium]|nr:hypothetical protein [Lachnospiraceae bacterium]